MAKMIKNRNRVIDEYENDPVMKLLKPFYVENGMWESIVQRDMERKAHEKRNARFKNKKREGVNNYEKSKNSK